MDLTKFFPDILELPQFTNKPLIFVDVGASGKLSAAWKPYASYSICLAFDADNRDFSTSKNLNKEWMCLQTINRIVCTVEGSSPFYLTASPHCSSTLKPLEAELGAWEFCSLFKTDKILEMPTTTLSTCCSNLGINYIDWFKTDSQGTDLRIWNSLPSPIRKTVILAQFEPGIIDAYKGEDKLYSVMRQMDDPCWWLSSMDIRGSKRISTDLIRKFNIKQTCALPISPGWAELWYLKTIDGLRDSSDRDLLVAWMFSVTTGQLGHALLVADIGANHNVHKIFAMLREVTLSAVNSKTTWLRQCKSIIRAFRKTLGS